MLITSDSQLESRHIINEPITIYKLQGPMTNFRISALLLALSPLWVSASVSAEELNQVDPVSAIDAKITEKNSDIERISATKVSATENLKQLQNKNRNISHSINIKTHHQ